MLRKIIEHEDFEGNPCKTEAYFNLTQSEIMKFMVTDGNYTLDKKIIRLFSERNGAEIMSTFEQLIDMSYGRKSLDGLRFEKSPEILAEFKSTLAYDKLFMELVTDSNKAADFFNAVVPKDMAEKMKDIVNGDPEDLPEEIRDLIPTKKED